MVREVAQRLHISPDAVLKRIKFGRLPAMRVGGLWMIPAPAVDRLTAPRAVNRSIAAPPPPRPSIECVACGFSPAPHDAPTRCPKCRGFCWRRLPGPIGRQALRKLRRRWSQTGPGAGRAR